MMMDMTGMGAFSMLFGVIWLGLLVGVIVLATRLVRAVERIADSVGGQPGGKVTPLSRSPIGGV